MKQLKSMIFMVALFAMCGHLNAQYVTTHAKTAMPGQQKGIYYALPRTVIQLDLMVDKTELVEGPYSDFAYMIGASDVILDNDVEYVLRDVVMSTYAEADPNATFFVAMNTKKGESQPFYLNSKGILEGVGMVNETTVNPATPSVKVPVSADNKTFKYQYSSSSMRSEDQQARAAAEMISRIREEKIKLITGFQETAFTLDTYRQMYADLDAMEAEYLSLFVGKRVVTPVVQTVYVTLSKDVPLQTVGSFSKDYGFSTNVYDGQSITVQAISLQTTGNINALSPSAVESISHENKLFYRIPETVYLKVTLGDDTILECRETLAQFGVFMLAPLVHTKMLLDPNTGQIISMGME
ncbi:MAG: DUF4831 family protein [Bacteroidales bacterium]|nr:DUF4831 family protein [Bacteroidales bacterium]